MPTIQWHYEYSPFTAQNGSEIPAFEIFDHRADTILMTNEDQPLVQQENVARLVVKAPELAALGERIIRCWGNCTATCKNDNTDLAAAIADLAALLDHTMEAADGPQQRLL